MKRLRNNKKSKMSVKENWRRKKDNLVYSKMEELMILKLSRRTEKRFR